MMNISIVTGSFFPQISPRSFRATELAKELVRQGHKVDVYIPQTPYDYRIFEEENDLKVKFVKINLNAGFELKGNAFSIFIKRIANRIMKTYLSYPSIQFLWILPQCFSKTKGYDLLISIATPHPIHWGIDKSLRKNPKLSKIWIADCGDPFMLCQTDTFKNPFYFKSYEKSFCRKANAITIPVASAKIGYYSEFWDKLYVVPQGFDFTNIRKVERFTPHEVITFAYAGNLIPGLRDPRPVLDFLIEQDVDFRFYIYTKQMHLLKNYTELLGEKLILNDYIDRLDLIYKMSSYDFVLNLENGTTVQMPSKLIDYALCGRPVLSIFSQNIDRVKFLQFLNRDYSQHDVIEDMEDYNIKNVAKKFIFLANESRGLLKTPKSRLATEAKAELTNEAGAESKLVLILPCKEEEDIQSIYLK